MTAAAGAAPGGRRWPEAVVAGLLAFAAFRLLTEAVGLAAARALRPVAIWNQWDVKWLANISRQGYGPLGHVIAPGIPGVRDGAAFPPAMPLLMRAGGLLGVGPEGTGLAVSAVALAVALVLLYRLVADDHGVAAARWTLVLLLVYPFALFLGTAYAEALVLLGTVGAWSAARRGRWWLAGAAVALALLAKIVFALLLLPLTLELLGWEGGRAMGPVRDRWRPLLALWLPPLLALAAWMAYLAATFGQPLRFLSAQRLWGRAIGLPLADIRFIFDAHANAGVRAINFIDGIALLLLAGMAVYVYRRVRRTYGVMLGAFLVVFVCNTSLQSNGRHLVLLFPLFIGLAVLAAARRPLGVGMVLVQLPVAVVLVARFATGHWAG